MKKKKKKNINKIKKVKKWRDKTKMANENRQKMLKKRNHTAVLDRHTSAFNMESLLSR